MTVGSSRALLSSAVTRRDTTQTTVHWQTQKINNIVKLKNRVVNKGTDNEEKNTAKEQHMQLNRSYSNNESSDSWVIHFSWARVDKYQRVNDNYGNTTILLNNVSIFSIFNNHKMLLKTRSRKKKLKVYINRGQQDSNLIMTFPDFSVGGTTLRLC